MRGRDIRYLEVVRMFNDRGNWPWLNAHTCIPWSDDGGGSGVSFRTPAWCGTQTSFTAWQVCYCSCFPVFYGNLVAHTSIHQSVNWLKEQTRTMRGADWLMLKASPSVSTVFLKMAGPVQCRPALWGFQSLRSLGHSIALSESPCHDIVNGTAHQLVLQ